MECILLFLCSILAICTAQEQQYHERNPPVIVDPFWGRRFYKYVPLYTDVSGYSHAGNFPIQRESQMVYHPEDFARHASEKSEVRYNSISKEPSPNYSTSTTTPAPITISPVNSNKVNASAAMDFPQINKIFMDIFSEPNGTNFEGRSSLGEYNPYFMTENNYLSHVDLTPHSAVPSLSESHGSHATTSHLPASDNAMPLLMTAMKGLMQGGAGTALASSALSRLPGVLLKSLLAKAASTLLKSGIKGLIAKILVPLLVLVGVDVLILVLTWWLWEDSSCGSTTNQVTHVSEQSIPFQPY